MNFSLFKAIKESGLKHWQLAKAANVSESRISRILNENARPPTEEEAVSISKALNKKPSEFWNIRELKKG